MMTTARRPILLVDEPAHRARALVFGGRELALAGVDRPLVHWAKRGIDLVLATLLLVFLAPMFVAVVIAIRLTSPGPATFVQERWGSRRVRRDDGVVWEAYLFPCIKFRTMTQGVDDAAHREHVRAFVNGSLDGGPEADTFKMVGDARITRLGQVLRRGSIDELPQLINVLRGEMSLVGPRPVPPYEVASYPDDDCLARLGALPGLTGEWQVHGRTSAFEEMIELDLDYVRRPSLLRDLQLLVLTVPGVWSRRGAH
jgi:lipopolysaccharide/colanic/teichoic acid biosynthesis glycosyltransferase